MAVGVEPLKKGSEDYCAKAVARGMEDYYVGSGEAPGRWLGGGCEELGLEGEVDPEVFARVLKGQAPDGTQLVKRKKAGFDLAFSPPKSISVLWGLANSDVARVVQECHDEAVAVALGYIESQGASVGVRAHGRAGGIEIKPASGFVAAAFDHRTSRAGDPQLHTHVVVSNMARAEGDKWRALGRHPDLYRHSKLVGNALYEAELRRLLTERLGVEWTWDDKHPEIVGVDKRTCDHYSKRHNEAVAAVAARGIDATPQAMQAAVLNTRRPKPGHQATEWSAQAGDYGVVPAGVEGLRDRWVREAREAGLPPLDLDRVLDQAVEHTVDWDKFAAELAGPEGLTEASSTFTRRDVIIAMASQPGVGAIEAIRRADDWLASGEAVSLGRRNGGEERWTTWDLLGQEAHLIASARQRADAEVAQVDADVVESVIEGRGLSAEQAEMVRRLTTSGRGVEVVVGRAGVGKTFGLDAARAAWEKEGIPVLGAALSAAAAGELKKGAKVKSSTIARQIIDAYKDGLPEGAVLILDEASMIDTRSLATLNRAVERANGKLVLVGDPAQLPAVEAGGVFARLAEGVGVVELSQVRRQKSAADVAALAEVRAGDLDAGLRALLGRDGRQVVAPDAQTQRAVMVHDWAEARRQGQSVLMLAGRRQRVEDLAIAAREARRANGELGEEVEVKITPETTRKRRERVWQPDSRAFSVGDEVLFTKNTTGRWKHLRDGMPGVYNGKAGVVVGVDKAAGTITVMLVGDSEDDAKWQAATVKQETEIADLTTRLDATSDPAEARNVRRRLDSRLADRRAGVVTIDAKRVTRPGVEVVVDAEYLAAGHVSYAYARTVHKSQGATCDVALVDGEDLRGREAAYVALSRHRAEVRVYLTQAGPAKDLERHQAETVRLDPLSELITRASGGEAQRPAVAQQTRASVEAQQTVRDLADLPPEDLAAEREALEARLAGMPAETAKVDRAVAEAEAALAEAQARDDGSPRAKQAVWRAKARLDQARQQAARRRAQGVDRGQQVMAAERARLAAIRAAEARQQGQ